MAEIPNIDQYINTPGVQQAQQQSQQAAQTAVNYQSAAGQLPQKLRRAIQENVDYNKDIITQQNEAAANYFAAPSVAREKYQNVFNPFEREKLVTQYRGQEYAPYASLTDILGERRGNISDIVGAGVGAFNSQVTAQQGAANIARQNYQDQLALGQLQYGGAVDAYNSQVAAAKAGSGSGGGGLSGLAELLGLGNTDVPVIPGEDGQKNNRPDPNSFIESDAIPAGDVDALMNTKKPQYIGQERYIDSPSFIDAFKGINLGGSSIPSYTGTTTQGVQQKSTGGQSALDLLRRLF